MDLPGFYITLNSSTENQTVLTTNIPRSFFEHGMKYEVGIQRINFTTNKKKCSLHVLCPQIETMGIIDNKVCPVLRIVDLKQLTWSVNYSVVQYCKFAPGDYIDLVLVPHSSECEGLQIAKSSITLHVRPYF